MSDQAYDILRAAITFARNEQIRTTSGLRARLMREYPGQDAHIEDALHAWAVQERRTA